MDPLLIVVAGILAPVVVFGFFPIWLRRRERAEDHEARRLEARRFHVEPARVRLGPLVTTPPLVSLPVASLAGLPISRPVVEGRMHRRKYGNHMARRRAVRRAVSRFCSGCANSRNLGRNYCLECERRLTPFLS